ncbi:MAG: DinB family protein [Actinomycetota bacterium]
MSDGLLDPFRHNSWATKELLRFCRDLSPDQLRATATGTYGTILDTLRHMIGAESRYRYRLSGIEPWPTRPEDTDDFDELERMSEELAGFWEELASSPFDPDRTIHVVNKNAGEEFDVKAGMLVAQVLNHGNEHRAQIFTILTTIGVEPPDLDAWSYGEATGRFVMISEG